MSIYLTQLETAVRAVTITSPTEFQCYGVPSPKLALHVLKALTERTARDYLLYNLQHRLYDDFYGQGAPAHLQQKQPPQFITLEFSEQLQRANRGDGCWDPDWKVRASDQGRLLVERNGLSLWLADGEYRISNGQAEPGEAAEVNIGKDLPEISPGYYLAHGNKALSAEDERDLVRLYWHVDPAGALLLVKAVTRTLNSAVIAFRLKVASTPKGFTRHDTAILYLRAADHAPAIAEIRTIIKAVSPRMRKGVPALTKELALGLGLAEDPGGQSFGLHRSMLIAEGLAHAYDKARTTLEERLSSVLDRFREAGIDPETPYLGPESKREYPEIGIRDPGSGVSRWQSVLTTDNGQRTTDNKDDYLQVAQQIARQIVRDAIWYGGECNWMGALPPGTTGIPHSASAYRALGPDLYAGTSGVALFLAELFAVTGGPDVRRTALGAITQALSAARGLQATEQLALYTGGLGVVLAALSIARLLHDESLHEGAVQLLAGLLKHQEQAIPAHDYLSGKAGAIVALLQLSDILSDDRQRELAAKLGDQLLQAAHKSRRGYSWSSTQGYKHRDLTGLSHGAAGIGLALLELYTVTQEITYREAAEMAFRYERSWFDKEQGNWPDFRFQRPQRGRANGDSITYRTFWCHGAPGIALSRLRAYSLTRDPLYMEEASIGLETTRKAVESSLQAAIHDFSLCHGLAGNCEVLLAGLNLQSDPAQEALFREVVIHAAATGTEQFGQHATHSNPQSDWPCGVGGGHTPSLILGTAGIGLFYLRLFAPEIRSPLLLTPSSQARLPRSA